MGLGHRSAHQAWSASRLVVASEPCGDECRSPDGAACGAIREDADHKTRITPQAAPSGLRTHPIGLNDDQGRKMLLRPQMK